MTHNAPNDCSGLSARMALNMLCGADAGICLISGDLHNVAFCNAKMAEHLGAPADLAFGAGGFAHPPQGMQALQALPVEEALSWHCVCPDGERHLRLSAKAMDEGMLLITSMDETEHVLKRQRDALRLRQQALTADIAQSFISPDDVDSLVQRALEQVGAFMDVSKIVLAAVERPSNVLVRRFGWYNEGHGITGLTDGGSFAFAPGNAVYDAFITNGHGEVVCEDAHDNPAFDYMLRFGALSYIIIPMWIGEEFIGILTLDDCQRKRRWHSGEVRLARLIAGAFTELMLRRRNEEQLLRMSAIINRSPQCVAYVSDGRIIFANQGASNITGYTREELIGTQYEMLFGEEFNTFIRNELAHALASGETQVFEAPLRRKDGEVRTLLISGFQPGFEQGATGFIAADITERRRLEIELLSAKEQAERANQAKSDFLSRMSHEMRTPMNAIIGMTSIAKTSPDVERKDYCLDKIDTASSHLLGVINDVLDMSKIEAGKFEMSYTDFILEKMLIRLTNVFTYRIDEKNLSFVVNLSPDMPLSILSDEQRLSQVLANLISNAIKFTPEGGGITLGTSMLEDTDGQLLLRFSVRDTGIGIEPEQMKKLFRSFEQADGSISRRFGGTGLGLAISKSIVELLGGQIGVESTPGGGSEFAFTIRAQRGESHKGAQKEAMNLHGLRLLVVDDSADVREYFQSLAKNVRMRCVAVSGGEEACRLMDRGEQFDVAFVDWKMPGMDGVELTRRIRKSRGENAVIIMISAAEWANIHDEAGEIGVNGFIPKPLFASVIIDSIQRVLGSAQAPALADDSVAGRYMGRRILLAEDVEINREIVIAMLEGTGVKIIPAADGAQAVELFMEDPKGYDMIFMDIHMPDVDGYEATRRIRALSDAWAKEVPIVAMTANVFREDIEACLAAGMNDHIGKPLSMEELADRMQRYLPRG